MKIYTDSNTTALEAATTVSKAVALADGLATALVTYTFGYIGIDDPTPPAGVSTGQGYVYTQNARVYGALNNNGVANNKFEILTLAALSTVSGGNIGFSASSSYASNTLGYAYQKLGGVLNYGTLTTGVNELVNREATMSVNPSNTSRAADIKWTTRLNGTGNVTEVRPFELGTQLYFNGTDTFGYGLIGYTRVGLNGTYSANVTSLRGIEYHVANEGNGTINTAQCFQAGDVDFRGDNNTTGTGIIERYYGFRANNLQGQGADAGRVTRQAISFIADDITAGAEETASFVSEMSSGLGKWAFLGKQAAPSALRGGLRLGDNAVPFDALEINGYAKLSSNGIKLTTGAYHESRQHQPDFIHYFNNRHASTPQGIVVTFSDASPNSTSRLFLLCKDSTDDRFRVYSNGAVVNSSNSYGAISDERLKRDIVDASPQLQDILDLQVRNFKLIADGEDAESQIGLVAQEVEKVCPRLVFEDADGLKMVAYSVLNIKLLKAVQELAARVEELEKGK